jgi:hypothetical protein
MANAIRPKRSNTAAAVPSASALAEGEIAINYADKKIYGKDSGGSVKLFTPSLATASAAGSIIVGSGLGVSSGTVSSNVRSVAGRGGSVVIVPGDVSGLSSVAASGSAADLTGTLTDARLTGNQLTVPQFQSHFNINPSWVENFPVGLCTTATSHSSGNMLINFFTPLVSKTVTQMTMYTFDVACSGLTFFRMGLYTFTPYDFINGYGTLSLVARIDNDTSMFASTYTGYTRSFSTAGGYPASYNLVAGQRYGIGSCMTATTYARLVSRAFGGAFGVGALHPRVAGQVVSTTDLPTAGTNTVAITSICMYARLS